MNTKKKKKSGARKSHAHGGPRDGSSHAVAPPPARPVPTEELFMQAELALMGDDIAQAGQLYKECVNREPENVEYLDGYGSFLAEFHTDDPEKKEEAIAMLKKACDLAPTNGFEKFMYLGQVLDASSRPREAEAAMRQGVGILRDLEDEHAAEFLTSALCSLAELLMGLIHDADIFVDEEDEDGDDDLMDQQDKGHVMAEVEALLQEALALRSDQTQSPEPLQALCSLRVLQGREEEALSILHESLKLWWMDEADEKNEGDGEEEDIEDERVLPSYEFRFETAKLLLELDHTTETAADILEGLLDENDSVPDVWLLLAVAYRAGGELESAAEAASQGAKIARQHGYTEQDHEVVYALEELEKELSAVV